MKYLLNNNIWAFSANASNLKRLAEGMKVVVYLSGVGNRCFAAEFVISSKPYKPQERSEDPDWLLMFPIRIGLDNVKEWEKRLSIVNVVGDLKFIQDKKNYGLYFRQSRN